MTDLKSLLAPGVNLAEIFPKRLEIAEGKIILEKSPVEKKPYIKFKREELHKIGWPINSGTYSISDPQGAVAVVCPRQDAVLQSAALNYGAAISGPCITPGRGVELVITNTISNPNLRWLILAGKDSGHLSGDVIYCVSKYGVNPKTKRVNNTKCPTNPFLPNLSEEAIKRFQKQVKVINLLQNYDDKNPKEVERIKEEIGLMIRACLQEPENAIKLINTITKEEYHLYDKGVEDLKPFIVNLEVEKIGGYYEGYSRAGTTIHAITVAEAEPMIKSHILQKGNWGRQESTRMVLSATALQTVIYNTKKELFPTGWRPFNVIHTDEEAWDYLEKYRTWVYLFPLSDVKFDEKIGKWVPYIPDNMDYVYGGRLTAYWYEIADEKEKKAIRDLVSKMHLKFYKQIPDFEGIIDFYERLAKIQKRSFNQIYATAKAAKVCVENDIGNSYRLYMSLQIPPLDIKDDPRKAHNPCFCLYEVYPRLIAGGRWQLDCCFFLRAHDILAFPANANGGIAIQNFIARYASIKPGLYIHHAGSLEVCDYLLPKEILEKFQRLSDKPA